MKKYLIIIVIFVIFGCGTDQGPTRIYDYTVTNKSGYNVGIIAYNQQGTKLINNEVVIINNQSLSKIG